MQLPGSAPSSSRSRHFGSQVLGSEGCQPTISATVLNRRALNVFSIISTTKGFKTRPVSIFANESKESAMKLWLDSWMSLICREHVFPWKEQVPGISYHLFEGNVTSLPNPLQRTWSKAQPSSCLCSVLTGPAETSFWPGFFGPLTATAKTSCLHLTGLAVSSRHPTSRSILWSTHKPFTMSDKCCPNPSLTPKLPTLISTVLVSEAIPQEEQSLSNLRPSMKYFNGCLNSVRLPYRSMETYQGKHFFDKAKDFLQALFF